MNTLPISAIPHSFYTAYPSTPGTQEASTTDPLNIANSMNYVLKDLLRLIGDDKKVRNLILERKIPASMLAAVKVGNLKIIQHLVENENVKIEPDLLVAAARNGHTDIVQYLFSHYPQSDTHKLDQYIPILLVNAIKSHNLELIEYVYKRLVLSTYSQKSISREVFWSYVTWDPEPNLLRKALLNKNIAAKLGDLLVIDDTWKRAYKYKLFLDDKENDPNIQNSAIKPTKDAIFLEDGDILDKEALYMLKLLESHQIFGPKELSPLILPAYLSAAIKYGSEGFFSYLIQNKDIKLDISVLNHAAAHGQLLIARYLIEIIGIEPTEETLFYAFTSLNIDLCRYLFYNRGMIGDENAAHYLELQLSLLCGDDSFSDCLSELEQDKAPLKSVLRKSNREIKNIQSRRVGFNLNRNELYLVSKYIENIKSPGLNFDESLLEFFMNLFGYRLTGENAPGANIDRWPRINHP